MKIRMPGPIPVFSFLSIVMIAILIITLIWQSFSNTGNVHEMSTEDIIRQAENCQQDNAQILVWTDGRHRPVNMVCQIRVPFETIQTEDFISPE